VTSAFRASHPSVASIAVAIIIRKNAHGTRSRRLVLPRLLDCSATDVMKYLIVDAHEDIAFNMLCAGRDYRQSVTRRARSRVGVSADREHRWRLDARAPQWLDGSVSYR
jgi:hypothetical protein